MKKSKEVGSKYEEVAKDFLVRNGYIILYRNFFAKVGEIDIVAKDNDYLCFVEVKYRDKKGLIDGITAVDKRKQKRILKAARFYLYEHGIDEDSTLCRFDVVSIDGDDIKLIKNAF